MVIDMNRQKHAMLYWGQEVLRVPSRGKDLLALNADTISYLNLPVDRAWLELREIHSIKSDEVMEFDRLFYGGTRSTMSIKECIDTAISSMSAWHIVAPDAADFLRLRGFITPWAEFTITQIIGKGWIRARAGK